MTRVWPTISGDVSTRQTLASYAKHCALFKDLLALSLVLALHSFVSAPDSP